MLDIKLVRENPDLVKENIKKKFQEEKLALVDEVIELDKKFRESKQRADELRASRNKISKEIGGLMASSPCCLILHNSSILRTSIISCVTDISYTSLHRSFVIHDKAQNMNFSSGMLNLFESYL